MQIELITTRRLAGCNSCMTTTSYGGGQQQVLVLPQLKNKKSKPGYLMPIPITMPATPKMISLTPVSDGFDPQADREWLVDNIAFNLSSGTGMAICMELKR